MAWLIIDIVPVHTTGAPPVAKIRKRGRLGDVSVATVESLLTRAGFELGPIVGPTTTAGGWPLTALVYTSADRDGFGRSGSTLHRWPVRRREG